MNEAHEAASNRVSIEYTRKEALLNNIPGMLTYALGSVILFHLWVLFGVLYLFFCIIGIVLFWTLICSHCPSYDKRCCPCGYGTVSSRFFKKGDPSRFPRMFKTYIPVFSLIWIFPLLGGVILLLGNFALYYLLLVLSFFIVGFVLVPLFSRVHGCKDCSMKEKCPWAK